MKISGMKTAQSTPNITKINKTIEIKQEIGIW